MEAQDCLYISENDFLLERLIYNFQGIQESGFDIKMLMLSTYHEEMEIECIIWILNLYQLSFCLASWHVYLN